MIKEIDKNLFMLTEKHPDAGNIYLIKCGSLNLFIDTGLFNNELIKFKDGINFAVNTHSHADHTGGNYLFDYIFMHPLAEKRIRKSDIAYQYFYDFDSKKSIPKNDGYFSVINDVDINLSDGDDFLNLKVIYTPGHTKDSICLYEPVKKWIFTGDTYYNGYPYFLEEESEIIKWIESIEKINSLEVKLVLPGHNEFVNEVPRPAEFFKEFKVVVLD